MSFFSEYAIEPINSTPVNTTFLLYLSFTPEISVSMYCDSTFAADLTVAINAAIAEMAGVSNMTSNIGRSVNLGDMAFTSESTFDWSQVPIIYRLALLDAIRGSSEYRLGNFDIKTNMFVTMETKSQMEAFIGLLNKLTVDYKTDSTMNTRGYLIRNGKLGIPILNYTLERLRKPTGRIVIEQIEDL